MARIEAAARGGAARRVIVWCICWYVAAAALFTLFESAIVFLKVDREIADRINVLQARVMPSLTRAQWNLDHEQARLILDGMAGDPSIARVELRDNTGVVAVAVDRSPADAAGGTDRSKSLKSFPLNYSSLGQSSRHIGDLVIFTSSELKTARLKDTVLFSLERTALLVFLLAVILAAVIERGLGRPLREFAGRIAETDPSSADRQPIVLEHSTVGELALAAEAFNAMAAHIGETVAALNESRARLWSAFDDSPISLWEEDFSAVKRMMDEAREAGVSDWKAFFEPDERVAECSRLIRVIDVNRSTLELLGLPDKSLVLNSLKDDVGDQANTALRQEFIALASGALSWEGESVYRTPSGRSSVLHIRLGVVPGHEDRWNRVLLSMLDITTQKHAEEVLRQSLEEKELLLREVHHRVKNNLQIICSLIGIKSGTIEPGSESASSLADLESRVWAMSLVHELLYESEDFAALDLAGYVRKLCDRIVAGFADAPGRISLTVEVDPDVRLPLDKAIPCGLLINELVVNSFKHAFPDGRRGTIAVRMRRTEVGLVALSVADDGIGASDIEALQKPHSIGWTIATSLARQLGGSLSSRGSRGFEVDVSFPEVV